MRLLVVEVRVGDWKKEEQGGDRRVGGGEQI